MVPDHVISVYDDFYILATSARLDDPTPVLKHEDTFAIFDRFGDIDELKRPRTGSLPPGYALPLPTRTATGGEAPAPAEFRDQGR